jgi:hypothetical protein
VPLRVHSDPKTVSNLSIHPQFLLPDWANLTLQRAPLRNQGA